MSKAESFISGCLRHEVDPRVRANDWAFTSSKWKTDGIDVRRFDLIDVICTVAYNVTTPA